MRELVRKLWRQEEGQALAEYGLILALIAVIAIAGLTLLGESIRDRLNNVGEEIKPTS